MQFVFTQSGSLLIVEYETLFFNRNENIFPFFLVIFYLFVKFIWRPSRCGATLSGSQQYKDIMILKRLKAFDVRR